MDDSNYLFSIGMRILAVDHDPTCLQVLETLLQTYQYHGLLFSPDSYLFFSLLFFMFMHNFMSDLCV